MKTTSLIHSATDTANNVIFWACKEGSSRIADGSLFGGSWLPNKYQGGPTVHYANRKYSFTARLHTDEVVTLVEGLTKSKAIAYAAEIINTIDENRP